MNAAPLRVPVDLQSVEQLCNSATLLHDSDEFRTVDGTNEWLLRNGWAPIESDEQVARLRDEREIIRDYLVDRSDPGARRALNLLLQKYWGAPQIDDTDQLTFAPAVDTISPVSAATAALILSELASAERRLKACASAECRYVFYDSSRSRNRTWCDMNVCGARHKMRQYRTRLSTNTN